MLNSYYVAQVLVPHGTFLSALQLVASRVLHLTYPLVHESSGSTPRIRKTYLGNFLNIV